MMGAFADLVVQEALVAFEVLLFEFGEAGGGGGFGLAPFGTGALDSVGRVSEGGDGEVG